MKAMRDKVVQALQRAGDSESPARSDEGDPKLQEEIQGERPEE